MAAKKPENMNFEAVLSELEQIVEKLERGDVPLEQALQFFERGIALTRAGQQKLTDAEQRVHILLSQSSEAQLQPFNTEIE